MDRVQMDGVVYPRLREKLEQANIGDVNEGRAWTQSKEASDVMYTHCFGILQHSSPHGHLQGVEWCVLTRDYRNRQNSHVVVKTIPLWFNSK